MHSPASIRRVLDLHAAGFGTPEIARQTNIARGTVRMWVAGRLPRSAMAQSQAATCTVCGGTRHDPGSLPPEYVYLLGMYLGDGCISAHPRQVYKLRLTLDAIYPGIIAECEAAIRAVLPANKVGRVNRRGGFENSREGGNVEVYSYSRAWPCLLPQHGPGLKHRRAIVLTDWQLELVDEHPELLLRGLIHSDGCRFVNTGRGGWKHPRYSFVNTSADIRAIFCQACDRLGVRWTEAPRTVYVSRKADVALLDEFIGPKR